MAAVKVYGSRRSVSGGPVDRLTQQVGVATVPGVLLDHVDDRPAKRVLAWLGLARVAFVHARRPEVSVDDGDLVPERGQRVGHRGVGRYAPLLVVVEQRRDVRGEQDAPEPPALDVRHVPNEPEQGESARWACGTT